jgi:hypothetical protein
LGREAGQELEPQSTERRAESAEIFKLIARSGWSADIKKLGVLSVLLRELGGPGFSTR